MRFFLISIAITTFFITSCSPVKLPAINTYTLTALNASPIKTKSSALSLLVSIPEASAGYDTAEMAYTERPYQLQYFAKNQWIAPPAQMLLPLIVTSLQNTEKFRAVVPSPFTGITDLRLDTRLLYLYEDAKNGTSYLEMGLHAQLVNMTTQRVIATRAFYVSEPLLSPTPYENVQAANRATSKILQQLTDFVLTQRN